MKLPWKLESFTDVASEGLNADLLGRVVDHLGIKRAVFAGHSVGAHVM